MHKYIITLLLLFSTTLNGQEEIQDLPMGFRDITLGLSLEETKSALKNDKYFNYRGDPDVSLLLFENKSIIETLGYDYIENGYFQFYKEELYTITLVLDRDVIDYQTLFSRFTKKYGKHNSLNPEQVIWENDKIKLYLEKPLTIKYVGLNVFNEIIQEDITEEATKKVLREEFLDEL